MSIWFSLIILFIALYLDACIKDEQRQRRIARKRHQEKMKALKAYNKQKKQPPKKRKVTRTIAKDANGRTIIQEIIEEIDGDYDDEEDEKYHD